MRAKPVQPFGVRLPIELLALVDQSASLFKLSIGLGEDHRLTTGRALVLRQQGNDLKRESLPATVPAAKHNKISFAFDGRALLRAERDRQRHLVELEQALVLGLLWL